jgi:predicted hydrocarbon binding protein/KaiC/GvpD/RAD55 family RecA-like ATPase
VLVSLSQLQDVPTSTLILLIGPPGSGKTTFCKQTILQNLVIDRSTIYVTTEYDPSKADVSLRDQGLGKIEPGSLSFIDAYNETVGVVVGDRPDTIHADCNDLSSIDIAISKLTERLGRSGILLVFDSLTAPYLFNGSEILRFMKQTLSRFAAQGNAVLACMDTGCGKEEDLGAMMSVADGIIRMNMTETSRVITVVKHPQVAPTTIKTPLTWNRMITVKFDPKFRGQLAETTFTGSGKQLREVGDFVNVFWRSLVAWSGMLWDPKRFPTMSYDLVKELDIVSSREMFQHLPWRMKLFMKFMPKNFSEVKNMKKIVPIDLYQKWGLRVIEYLEDVSTTDEHHFKVQEGYNCWGLENVGARLAFQDCGLLAGDVKVLESERSHEDRDWNVVETKCVGLGDPYCELKVVPGEVPEMREFLEGIDNSIVDGIHDRLMDQLVGFLVHRRPLGDRPRLGSGFLFPMILFDTYPSLLSERFRMALRMGGAKAGKEVGEHLLDGGIAEDQAVRRLIDFMEYCKVGKITLGETIRMKENCETFGLDTGEPTCHFTTGFLNGFFSAVKNQHVKETRCIAMGDPYCEWEFR